jgi:hypothetical protein
MLGNNENVDEISGVVFVSRFFYIIGTILK